MNSLHEAFVIVSVILFAIAFIGPDTGRYSLGWLGLAFFAASTITA